MDLVFDLPVGLNYNGAIHTEVELLPSNGIAEKVYVKKLADRPFTWHSYVLAVSIKRIGDIYIGEDVRKNYEKTNSVSVPEVIRHLTIADTNTLIVEIHRRVWENQLKKQELMCKYCGDTLKADIDLDKIVMLDDVKEFMATNPDLRQIYVYLKSGFNINEIKELKGDEFATYKDVVFNKLTFRNPLLRDAIQFEKISDDSIGFWRKIASVCLTQVAAVTNGDTPEELTHETLPEIANTYLGTKLYDGVLTGRELKQIREELVDYLPTLPFMYLEECPCDKAKMIPYVMEATNFFSE